MKCGFCGREFDEEAAARTCKGCAMFGGCGKVRCPHCSCESPRETRLVKWIRKWKNRTKQTAAK